MRTVQQQFFRLMCEQTPTQNHLKSNLSLGSQITLQCHTCFQTSYGGCLEWIQREWIFLGWSAFVDWWCLLCCWLILWPGHSMETGLAIDFDVCSTLLSNCP